MNTMNVIHKDLITMFPTMGMRFAIDNCKKMNMKIANYLLKQQRDTKPNLRSVSGGGWHSELNLTDLDYDWSRDLKNTIISATQEYANVPITITEHKLETWGIVLDAGAYSNYHTHPGWTLSGVYYVKVPDSLRDGINDKEEGCFAIPDVRAGTNNYLHQGSTFIIPPQEGTGFIFPSWVPHYVKPQYSKQPRISISWNINFQYVTK